MKIATWNVERPLKSSPKTVEIINILKSLNADIIVLTETNEFIDLGEEYKVYHTAALQDPKYKKGERRVSIFSKYPQSITAPSFKTFNNETSICINFNTPLGELAVYGTIIGILGLRKATYVTDLEKQLIDIENICKKVDNFCFIGDLNMTFSDNIYSSDKSRNKLNDTFMKSGLNIYTEEIYYNIDHIVLSEKFVDIRNVKCSNWNDPENKQTRLSDHKGVMIEIAE